MNPMQAPNVGVGGKDHGNRDKTDNRLALGKAWMWCSDCGAKLCSFDGNKDSSRGCPKKRNGKCAM